MSEVIHLPNDFEPFEPEDYSDPTEPDEVYLEEVLQPEVESELPFSQEDAELYDRLNWTIKGGTYKAESPEEQAERIKQIEAALAGGLAPIEITIYAMEMGGKIRNREQALRLYENLENLDENDVKGRKKLLDDERRAQLVQTKIKDIWQRYASGYDVIEVLQLRDLTSSHGVKTGVRDDGVVVKANGPLRAIHALRETNSVIGQQTARKCEAIIRTMIAIEEGNEDKLPKPQSPLYSVQ